MLYLHIIADNRAKYYSENDPDTTYEDEYGLNDDYEITDWAANNMDWEDVEAHAIKISEPDDFQEGWVNGKKEILNEKPKELET